MSPEERARWIAYHDQVVCPDGYCTDEPMTYPKPPDEWTPATKEQP